VRLRGNNYHRMAKNPLRFALIWGLIFHALHTRQAPGKKVMILATSTTVKKPPITPATPKRSQDWWRNILDLGGGMRDGYTEESYYEYEPNFRREEHPP